MNAGGVPEICKSSDSYTSHKEPVKLKVFKVYKVEKPNSHSYELYGLLAFYFKDLDF